MERTAATDAFFAEFQSARGIASNDYDVVAFGDSAAMADELAALVESRTKRATASLRRDYGEGWLPWPRVGDHVVVVDSKGVPRVIWRTTEIVIKPLVDVVWPPPGRGFFEPGDHGRESSPRESTERRS